LLQWNWNYGDHIKFFEQKAELGLATPLDSAPTVDQVQLLIYDAYLMLNRSRQGNNISFMEIEAYCRLFSVPDIKLFVTSIQSLDKKLKELNNGNQD